MHMDGMVCRRLEEVAVSSLVWPHHIYPLSMQPSFVGMGMPSIAPVPNTSIFVIILSLQFLGVNTICIQLSPHVITVASVGQRLPTTQTTQRYVTLVGLLAYACGEPHRLLDAVDKMEPDYANLSVEENVIMDRLGTVRRGRDELSTYRRRLRRAESAVGAGARTRGVLERTAGAFAAAYRCGCRCVLAKCAILAGVLARSTLVLADRAACARACSRGVLERTSLAGRASRGTRGVSVGTCFALHAGRCPGSSVLAHDAIHA